MISQMTDDDLGTNTGVNLRTHHLRFDYGIARKISLQSLFYIQNELRSSGDFPNFFVPLNAFTPRQYACRSRSYLVFDEDSFCISRLRLSDAIPVVAFFADG
jgi:hypothetical protein